MFILLDTSSSMVTLVDDIRRIDALALVLAGALLDSPNARIFAFNNELIELDNAVERGVTLPEPSGGTALAEALAGLSKFHARQLLLITDGEPDNPNAALIQAKKLGCVIHVRFVGDANSRAAISFCRNLSLCSRGGVGRALVADLGKPDLLTADIRRLLLTGPRP